MDDRNLDLWQSSRQSLKANLQKAVQLDVPYCHRDERWSVELQKRAKDAAVLVLFGVSQSHQHEHQPQLYQPQLLFTRRADSVETHRGQMAFPGGMCELADQADFVETALRETHEEVGILSDKVEVIGQLPILTTLTGYLIQPIVGLLRSPVEEISLIANPSEIAEAFWIPLVRLSEPGAYRYESYPLSAPIQGDVSIDVYQVDHYRIWGATGSMTKNILDRLLALR